MVLYSPDWANIGQIYSDGLSHTYFDAISMGLPVVYFKGPQVEISNLFVLFDLILYVPSTIFQLNRDWSSWVEPVLS